MRLSYTCNLASTVIAIKCIKFDVVCLSARFVAGFIDILIVSDCFKCWMDLGETVFLMELEEFVWSVSEEPW